MNYTPALFIRMSTINGQPYSTPRNINLKNGLLRFGATNATNKFGSTGNGLYINASNQLIFAAQGVTTTLGSAGSVANFSLNDAYDDGREITVDSLGVLLTGSIATGVLQITNTSSGALISLSHTTNTNNDILGTGSTWKVTGQGRATFTKVILGDDETIEFGASTDATVKWINASSVLRFSGAVDFADAVTTDASSTLTMTGTAGTDVITVTAGDLVVSDGSLIMTDADNAATLSVTNNTATSANTILFTGSGTFTGTGASSFVRVSATGLTTGTALTVIANTASTSVGVVDLSMTGLSSGSALRVTGGGANLTSGGKLIEVAMGAATDGAGLTITSSGVYTGAGVLQLVANSATSATGILNVSATGLTSGSAVLVTSSTANFTTGGKMIELAMVAATAGNGLTVTTTGAYTGTGLAILSAGAMTTGILLSLISTTGLTSGSLLRATTSTAGELATNGAYSLRGTGAHTSASNTGLLDVRSSGMVGTAANSTLVNFMATGAAQVDTTLLNVEASGFTTGYTGTMVRIKSPTTTGAGTVLAVIADGITSGGTAADISVDALTTGLGLNIANSGGAMTTGSLLRVTAQGTGAIATNGIVSFTHTGAFTSTSAVDGGFVEIKANDTVAGTILNLVGDALTTGIGVQLSNATSAMTTGSLLRVTASGTGTIATNGIVSITHGGIFVSTANAGVLDVRGSAMVGTATLVNFMTTAADQLTTTVLNVENSGFTTGYTGSMVRIKSPTTTGAGKVVELIADGITSGGTAMSISVDALTTGLGLAIENGTAATTSGSLLRVTAGGTGAVATNGIVSFAHTGVYTSTSRVGLLNVNASATTGGTVAHIMGAAVTDGTILSLEAVEATLTTGLYIQCYDGAANDFSVGRYGATIIAGNAALTAALTMTKGDFVMSDGVMRLATTATVTADVGSIQGGSAITRSLVEIAVSANAGDAVTLPTAIVGQVVLISNHGAQSVDVFPASGDAINEAAGDSAKALAANAGMLCFAYDATNWECYTLAR